ncbi:MAG: hypothetical protein DI529_11520 [Chryseobacterium sp.]|nr:MAG: hypothetical protein DI529_11520 [Chryseobacterium sp.]
MKKLLFIGVLLSLTISCIPDKDKRDKRKQDHSAEHMRNRGVDSAAVSSQKNTADTISNKK